VDVTRPGRRGGIEAAGEPADHLVLCDPYVHHIDEEALNIGGADHLLVERCRFAYCGIGGNGGPAGQGGGNRHVVVRDCCLGYAGRYYQGGPGPGPYDRPDGFGIEPAAGPVENPERCQLAAVTIPEALAVQETRRPLDSLAGIPVRCSWVVANMVSASGSCAFCAAVREEQLPYLRQIETLGPGCVRVPALPSEPRGVEALDRVARLIY